MPTRFHPATEAYPRLEACPTSSPSFAWGIFLQTSQRAARCNDRGIPRVDLGEQGQHVVDATQRVDAGEVAVVSDTVPQPAERLQLPLDSSATGIVRPSVRERVTHLGGSQLPLFRGRFRAADGGKIFVQAPNNRLRQHIIARDTVCASRVMRGTATFVSLAATTRALLSGVPEKWRPAT